MKKLFGFASVLALLTACSDGDMVFENLNFDNKEIQKCTDNELYFKINDRELLLIDFSYGNKSSRLDSLAPLNQPQSFKTDDNNKIYYRTYDSAINKNGICAILAPANPKVVSEYTSINGGTILYTRTMNPAVKDGSVNISYLYTINLQNVTLNNGQNDIKYSTLPFGSYIYDNSKLSFDFKTNFNLCNNNNTLTAYTNNEIILFNLPDNFTFPQTKTTQTISLSEKNNINYIAYKNNFNVDDICTLPNQIIKEDWNAVNGSLVIDTTPLVNNATGAVTGYKHQIKIAQAQFYKGESSFLMTERVIGEFNQ